MAGLPKVQRILGGILMNTLYNDWLSLVLEAKKAGISKEEVLSFFSQHAGSNQEKVV